MSKRMNYGKRFRTNSVVGGSFGLNEISGPKYHLIGRDKTDVELALIVGKSQSNGKASKARVGKLPTGDPPKPKAKSREAYEKEVGVVITEVVHRLEQALEELNKAPALTPQDTPLINRRQVMEAIHKLRLGFVRREGEVKNR